MRGGDLLPAASGGDGASRLRLRLGWAAWLSVALGCMALVAASLPQRYAALRSPTDPSMRAAIAALGISPEAHALYNLGVEMLGVLGFFALAVLIVWRRPTSGAAISTSALLIAFGAALPGTAFAVISNQPIWRITPGVLQGFGWFSVGLFALLFPNWRFVPRRSRFLVLPWALWVVVFFAFADRVTQTRPVVIAVSYAVWVLFLGLGVCAQIYRYHWVSTPQQRQQTKWVMLGFAGSLVGALAASVQHVLSLSVGNAGQNSVLYEGAAVTLLTLTALLIPLSITIAILRYNLYDIDRLLNLSLVYGSLTVALALLYAVCVALLQLIVQTATGQRGQSPLVLVVSTLGIAALVHPLRRRIQRSIDRRFFRRRYNAAKTLAVFSAELRGEMDLGQLTERLAQVVERTMEPASVSLWLSPNHANGPDVPTLTAGGHAPITASRQ